MFSERCTVPPARQEIRRFVIARLGRTKSITRAVPFRFTRPGKMVHERRPGEGSSGGGRGVSVRDDGTGPSVLATRPEIGGGFRLVAAGGGGEGAVGEAQDVGADRGALGLVGLQQFLRCGALADNAE